MYDIVFNYRNTSINFYDFGLIFGKIHFVNNLEFSVLFSQNDD